jgi:hypothetical protein
MNQKLNQKHARKITFKFVPGDVIILVPLKSSMDNGNISPEIFADNFMWTIKVPLQHIVMNMILYNQLRCTRDKVKQLFRVSANMIQQNAKNYTKYVHKICKTVPRH